MSRRMPKHAKSVDINETDIVKALEAIGCEVWRLGRPVDLLVGYQKTNYLIEVKAPGTKPRKDQQKQQKWIKNWRGQVRVVQSVDEAIRLVTHAYRR